ncbi:MAG: SDR family oxidoreductase [Methanoregula sp.]|uniref:SDR family oxidoreductase n=1 Tax=Methanoregula sp. TaxID=2052170 RepID=UPI0025D85B9D|nr:SDR family oxidoreductase [Methanoregula sp.]MCK9631819.1 SDR family oxidoreductase [Methanoregula sp.]
MRFVVTGGAGFIGSHIAETLARRGDEVVILDNLFSGRVENIQHLLDIPAVTFLNGSITDQPFLRNACKGADGIFHEAAITSVPRSVKDPIASNDANVSGTLNVLVAAQKCGVNKIVYASSSSVYGDTPTLPKREDMVPNPKSPYAITKLAGEYYLKVFHELYGIDTVSLRYFNVFGPRQDPHSEYSAVIPKFITKLLHHESPVIYGDGSQTRDFTYVKDVAQANVRAMDSPAQGIFNVAYGSRISLVELAHLIMESLGEEQPLTFEPPRSGDIHDSLAAITAAQDAFGYAPEYTVKTGLQETIQWYQNQ